MRSLILLPLLSIAFIGVPLTSAAKYGAQHENVEDVVEAVAEIEPENTVNEYQHPNKRSRVKHELAVGDKTKAAEEAADVELEEIAAEMEEAEEATDKEEQVKKMGGNHPTLADEGEEEMTQNYYTDNYGKGYQQYAKGGSG
jgi:flagellar basal body-associated protein FliL